MSSAVHTLPLPAGPVRGRGAQLVALALPVTGALGTLAVTAWAGGWLQCWHTAGDASFRALFAMWGLAPSGGAVAVVVTSRRALAGGTWPLLLGATVAAAALVHRSRTRRWRETA